MTSNCRPLGDLRVDVKDDLIILTVALLSNNVWQFSRINASASQLKDHVFWIQNKAIAIDRVYNLTRRTFYNIITFLLE